jgi:hypothetical protein
MTNAYEPKFMAEAYDLLAENLKTEIKELWKKEDVETQKQVTTWDVIFPFVLEHCGRDKLLELGKLIDEKFEEEYGVHEGFGELVAGYQLT